jgi:hypothetical protein
MPALHPCPPASARALFLVLNPSVRHATALSFATRVLFPTTILPSTFLQLVATMLYLDSENKKDMNIYINCSGGWVCWAHVFAVVGLAASGPNDSLFSARVWWDGGRQVVTGRWYRMVCRCLITPLIPRHGQLFPGQCDAAPAAAVVAQSAGRGILALAIAAFLSPAFPPLALSVSRLLPLTPPPPPPADHM